MFYDVFDSPLGALTVLSDGIRVTGLHIEGDRYFSPANIPANWKQDAEQPIFQQTRQELKEYFAHDRKEFDIPIQSTGTPFQQEVWNVIREIPYGQTLTYAEIAQKIHNPKAVRAVGSAVGRNPVCLITPCHRVLASDGTLGGFVAGLPRKQQLLELENALV